ncbi:MAG: hypothetical protein J5840_02535 [Lachnospiraceae bacterium]|nr:hypothetical protein [Lachnospiraceae bacterium]
MKKKIIIILIVVLIIMILVPVGWIAYLFPYNIPLRGKGMYETARAKARYNRYYFIDYGFFPDRLPANAKSVKLFCFSGAMQARPFFTLSFITDEAYFKKEVERYESYDVYLCSNHTESKWCMIEEGYTGEVKSYKELKETYSASGREIYIKVPDIPEEELSETCLYVVDDNCYIAYSSAGGRIVYHLDAEPDKMW